MHNSLTFWDDNSWMKLMTDFKRTDILLITEYKGEKHCPETTFANRYQIEWRHFYRIGDF